METTNQIALRPGAKSAIMIRREIAQIPAVMEKLGSVERAVFLASTAKPISEYAGNELVAELQTALKWIAKDIGYRATDDGDTQYLIIRTAEILKRYYDNLTLKDFRMAFEMSITGELDDFLPKGRDGQPDRGHYQQFNAEYVCKILNAYKNRRAWILKKANDAAPKAPVVVDPEIKRFYQNQTRKRCIEAFCQFKYGGRMPNISPPSIILFYDLLAGVGLVDEIAVSLAEQQAVLQMTIAEYFRLGKTGDVERLKKEGTNAKDVEFISKLNAREREIERAFGWMVENEIQITDYIKPIL